MRTVIANHDLTPRGLQLEGLDIEAGKVTIFANTRESRARCPVCASRSSRVHSRYLRTVSDLPWHGIRVKLEVHARRFFCDEPSCGRRIFCERPPEIAARARKTDRLGQALLAIALELGGRAGARLAEKLGIVAARDTLLRRVKVQEEGERPRPVRAVPPQALERGLPQRQAALPRDPRAGLPK